MILITDSNLIDPEDVFFVALHLHTGHKIWSGDEK